MAEDTFEKTEIQLTQFQLMRLYSLCSIITNAKKSGEKRVYISIEHHEQTAREFGKICMMLLAQYTENREVEDMTNG